MKNLLRSFTVLMLVLIVAGATAQTKPGFFVGIEARTNDMVATPTMGYMEAKAGYETRHVGIAAVYMTDSKARIKQSSMVGGELSATLFHVDAINIKAAAEALYLLRERAAWKKWAFTPKLSATTTILKHVEASFTILDVYHREVFRDWSIKDKRVIVDRWRFCDAGASLGFALKF